MRIEDICIESGATAGQLISCWRDTEPNGYEEHEGPDTWIPSQVMGSPVNPHVS